MYILKIYMYMDTYLDVWISIYKDSYIIICRLSEERVAVSRAAGQETTEKTRQLALGDKQKRFRAVESLAEEKREELLGSRWLETCGLRCCELGL